MFYRMSFKKFDSFLTRPLTAGFLILESKEFVNYFEKFLMLFVDDIYSNIEIFLPYKTSVHVKILLCQSQKL
jgi:hypothetical protein